MVSTGESVIPGENRWTWPLACRLHPRLTLNYLAWRSLIAHRIPITDHVSPVTSHNHQDMTNHYDLLTIGGGSGGVAVSNRAASTAHAAC